MMLYRTDLGRIILGVAMDRQRAIRPFAAALLTVGVLAGATACGADNSLEAAQMYANVGEVHRILGHGDRALPLYRKAQAIFEKALGPADPRISGMLSQEALILMDDGKLTLAEQSLNRALEGLHKGCPGCIAEISVAENNLGLLRLKQKRYAEADRLLTHVLTLQEQYLAKPAREMVDTLHNLAVVREKEQLHADAVQLHNRASAILSLQ